MKKILILIIFILLSSFVTSIESQQINNFPCAGNFFIQINEVTGNYDYNFLNCEDKEENKLFSCSCQENVSIVTNTNEYAKLTFKIQYYLEEPIGNEVNDNTIKRIETRTVELFKEKQISKPLNIDKNILYIISIVVILIIIAVLAFLSFWFYTLIYDDKIKRWLGVDEDKPMTFREIIYAIFTRKNIPRRTINGKIVKENVVMQEKKDKKNYDNEINDILKDL